MTPDPHEELFARAEGDVRQRLEDIRALAESRVPGCERRISYAMPALAQGKVFIHFAAFKKHIGIFPSVEGPADLVADLADYRGPKGNLIFPHARPLPLDLIGRVVDALAAQYAKAG